MAATGMLTNLFPNFRQEEQGEDTRLMNLGQMDPFQAAAYASYSGARTAGRGLGDAVASSLGADTRSSAERGEAVKRAVQAAGAQPGTEAYYTLLANEFSKNGLPDAAANVAQAWETLKLQRAHANLYEGQAAKANRVSAKDRLMDKYWETIEKIQGQGEAADPGLIKMRDNLGKALNIKDPSEWAVVPPTPTSPGYKYNKVTGETMELTGRIPPGAEGGASVPVTPVTIADPNDPSKTIVVDARTRKKIGDGPKLTETGKVNLKNQISHAGTADAIARARALLSGAGGSALPTESGVGTAVDYLSSLVGYTPKGAEQADQLRVVGGSLVRNVPRFEGPQSDKDVAYYKEVAGRIGDSSIPIQRRLAALDEVERIWGEFEGGKKYGFFSVVSPGITAPTAPKTPALGAPPPGAVRKVKKDKKQ